MSVRCKMKLIESTQSVWTTGRTLLFRAEYDASIPEDQRFCRATPNAEFKMQVDNQAALDQLVLGATYYFDIVEVPPAAALPPPTSTSAA